MKRIQILSMVLLIALTATSCTYFKKGLEKAKAPLEEKSKELNSGALIASRKTKEELTKVKAALSSAIFDTNGSIATIPASQMTLATNSVTKADRSTDVAINLLDRNEAITGRPIIDQTPIIMALISENSKIREAAEAKERAKTTDESKMRAKEEDYERKLIAYGAKYEEERNEKIMSYLKWGGILLLIIGGPIAMCVFMPMIIPFIVGKIPALSGVLGVPKTFGSNVVRSIGEVRYKLKQQAEFEQARKEDGLAQKLYTAEEVIALVDEQLDKELDARDKAIISHIRKQQNV